MSGSDAFQRGVFGVSGHSLANKDAKIDMLIGVLEERNAQIDALLLDLKVAKARSEAFADQLKAYKAQHPNTPLLALTEHRFQDGERKTKGRLIWEASFDKYLREAGVTNPLAYRAP